ncbi:AsmA family protein [Verrucomicrobiota bacterium sgz303538]
MKADGRFALSFRLSSGNLCIVNRLSKVILISLASLLVIALAAVIAVNLYVQSPSTQARIQEEITRALRIPIDITNASVTPWGGLRIAGITIPSEEGNFLEASSFTAKYRIIPLLRGKLIISTMILDSPRIVWGQNAEGRWVLPALPDTGERKRAKDAAAEANAPEPAKKKSSGIAVQVEAFELRDGSIELRDSEGKQVALGSDVRLTYSLKRTDRVEGMANIGRLAWKESLIFNDVRTPFVYMKGELTLPDLQAALGTGSVKGKLVLEPEKKDTPFSFDLHCDKIDLARVTAEAGWPAGQAAGMLSGDIELKGSAKKAERAEGKGQVLLTDGQFRQLEFFQTLGQVLQISELANLRLREGRANFRIADEKAFIENLVLDAPDIRLSAKGLTRFDGKLALDAELALSQRLAKQLPGFVRDNFGPANSDGGRSIPFKIVGRTDKPRSDLLDQLVGKSVGSQFDDLVSNLFGLKKKKDDGKKKKKDNGDKKDDLSGANDALAPASSSSANNP